MGHLSRVPGDGGRSPDKITWAYSCQLPEFFRQTEMPFGTPLHLTLQLPVARSSLAQVRRMTATSA